MQWLTQHDKEINYHTLKLQGQAMLKLQRTTSGTFTSIHDNFGSGTKSMCFFELTKKQSPRIKTQYVEAWFKVSVLGFMVEKDNFLGLVLSV